MKCKILTTEREQWLVLKPESEFETKVLDLFKGQPNTSRGEFEECVAGYMRQWSAGPDLIIKFPQQIKGETLNAPPKLTVVEADRPE